MRVLLVNPKMSSGWSPYQIPPLGLCSLKAACKDVAEVKVLDASGMLIQEVESIIRDYKPSMVGVTAFTEARHNAFSVLKMTKELDPRIVTLVGGVHATHTYEQLLTNYPFIDIVFIGEGEVSLPSYLGNGLVKGIAFRNSKRIKASQYLPIKNLDELPIPDLSDLNLSRYKETEGPNKGKSLVAVETSRGCPYNCVFCSSKSMWGNIRFKSVSRVIEELELLKVKYNCKVISFVDDIFTINKERTRTLCEKIGSMDLGWRCQTRTDCVDRETLQTMKDAGCYLIAFGVESGSPTILGNINKKEKPEDIKRAFNLCREVGLDSVFNIIVGSPGETSETLKETRQLIKECKPGKIGTAALRAYPGSGIWALGIEQKLFTEDILLTEKESIHYEGALTINQMYRELIKFRFLQARLRGVKGWIELLRMGFETLRDTPYKILRGVLR